MAEDINSPQNPESVPAQPEQAPQNPNPEIVQQQLEIRPDQIQNIEPVQQQPDIPAIEAPNPGIPAQENAQNNPTEQALVIPQTPPPISAEDAGLLNFPIIEQAKEEQPMEGEKLNKNRPTESVSEKRLKIQLTWKHLHVVPKTEANRLKEINVDLPEDEERNIQHIVNCPKKQRMILKDVSGTVMPGQFLAIIGATGTFLF